MPIDYNKYPPNWEKEIVPRILKRAGNKCEKCGLENKSLVFSYKMWIKTVENGKPRYKLKTFWTEKLEDIYRIDSLVDLNKVKRVVVVLTVAHLDHDEGNWDVQDDRLKAWCQYCHLNYDAKEKFNRVNNRSKQEKLQWK